jgi:branched-chain amino acid transport system ATP-binding protein
VTAKDSKSVITTENLVAGYLPGVNILNGATMHADKGELIGIIGPNGAGKSTLLKAIFGQVQVRSGTVSLEGKDITGLKANRLVSAGVAFVPQNNNVFPGLTVEENLQMGVFQKPKEIPDLVNITTTSSLVFLICNSYSKLIEK